MSLSPTRLLAVIGSILLFIYLFAATDVFNTAETADDPLLSTPTQRQPGSVFVTVPTSENAPQHSFPTADAHAASSANKPASTPATPVKSFFADLRNPTNTIGNRFAELTDENMQLMAEWQREHGYDEPDQDDVYQYYDDATLNALAQNGDAQALLLLGRRTWQQSQNVEDATRLFFNASVYGYTASLGELGGVHLQLAFKAEHQGDASAAREHLLKAQAWWQVGEQRGDKTLAWAKNSYHPAQPLTEAELHTIEQFANSYYEELSHARDEIGLPEFDNTPPKAFDIIFAESP